MLVNSFENFDMNKIKSYLRLNYQECNENDYPKEVDIFNYIAIALLEFSGNFSPTENEIKNKEIFIKKFLMNCKLTIDRKNLSDQELECFLLTCQGYTIEEIIQKMSRCKNTIKIYRQNILEKLSSTNMPQAIMNASGIGVDSQVHIFNYIAIALLESFGNRNPSEEGIQSIENFIKKHLLNYRISYFSYALTKQEIKCLFLIMDGRSIKDISSMIHRSIITIKKYRQNILTKLQATNMTQAIIKAAKLNFE